jgi:hypothetical protein
MQSVKITDRLQWISRPGDAPIDAFQDGPPLSDSKSHTSIHHLNSGQRISLWEGILPCPLGIDEQGTKHHKRGKGKFFHMFIH